jgi:very-short-patch-repair endonuclease
VLVFRSETLAGKCESLRGIPIASVARTLGDLSAHVSERALARAVREAVRLELTSVDVLVESRMANRGRRGAARLGAALARYSGLPLQRARSGAEIRALELLRDGGYELPRLNVRIAGEEADLSWVRSRAIIEIDGGPFHLDVGEDARKEATWSGAGWSVQRLPADAVYNAPHRLLALAEAANVRGYRA